MFPVIYGFDVFEGNEGKAIDVYLRHIEDVRRFFRDKPGVFLEHDFTAHPEWGPLCEFLSAPQPDRPFPHANKRPDSLVRKSMHWAYRRVAPRSYKKWVRDKT